MGNSDPITEYRKSLQETITTCEKEFDYRATYLSAGAIALTLAFIASDYFSQTKFIALLIVGIILEIIALIQNLQSFFYTKRLCRKDMKTIDFCNDTSRLDLYNMAIKRAKEIDRNNCINNYMLITGIVALTIFIGINTINIKNTDTVPFSDNAPATEQIDTPPIFIENNPTINITTEN